jgi:copper oxidase (laccase) domain-containing protein
MASTSETFPALQSLRGIRHGFTLRAPDVDVKVDRDLALLRLDEAHAASRRGLGMDGKTFVTGCQVHGRDVAVVDSTTPTPVPGVDGLITASPDVCLGVYVADCCPVYVADPVRRVIALLHSGRKGSELGIATAAIERMKEEFGCDPANLVIQLGPCIRPPHYEVDIAAQIAGKCRAAGVQTVHDCGVCTACHPERYYSYRFEKGKTGRMLAILALDP